MSIFAFFASGSPLVISLFVDDVSVVVSPVVGFTLVALFSEDFFAFAAERFSA
jgi:hypothetical protein